MNMKKLFLLNLPYLLFVYPFDKLAQAFRLAPGADLSGKLLSIGDGFTAALSSPWLSFHPTDLLIGIVGAVVLRMSVYLKGKNAKKYRHGIEYGSARWGTAADIAPYPCEIGNKERVHLLLHCLLTSPFPAVAVESDALFVCPDLAHNFIFVASGVFVQSGALCFQRVVAVKLRLRRCPAI